MHYIDSGALCFPCLSRSLSLHFRTAQSKVVQTAKATTRKRQQQHTEACRAAEGALKRVAKLAEALLEEEAAGRRQAGVSQDWASRAKQLKREQMEEQTPGRVLAVARGKLSKKLEAAKKKWETRLLLAKEDMKLKFFEQKKDVLKELSIKLAKQHLGRPCTATTHPCATPGPAFPLSFLCSLALPWFTILA
jgi:hypothetical protein